MSEKPDLNVIHRYLAGECTKEEKERIRRWQESDPVNRRAIENVCSIWKVEPRKEVEADIQKAWQRLEQQLEQRFTRVPSLHGELDYSKKSRPKSFVWINVAVIMVAGALTSLFVITHRSEPPAPPKITMREVVTKRAHQAQLTFSDGTKVVLNAASLIRFPERFDTQKREVYLKGEAYFEVAHQSGSPFIVQTQEARIEVRGTKFNVKARREEQVEVAVAQGKVAVQSNTTDSVATHNKNKVVLTKSQMSLVRSGLPPTAPRQINIDHYLVWLKGDFIFEEEPFSKVLKEWERRFDVHFIVGDQALLSVLFTGEFRNESLGEMLRLASQSLDFSYHRNNKTIIINQ